MTVYLIADIKITDPGWVPDYAGTVHKLVEQHGGRYLSRSGNIANLEGGDQDSTLIALIAFPDRAAFESFASDPAYAPLGRARRAGSVSRFRLIDDTDLAGTISYLRAG